MMILDSAQVRSHLPWPALIDSLGTMLGEGCESPERQHHASTSPLGSGTLLVMPAPPHRLTTNQEFP